MNVSQATIPLRAIAQKIFEEATTANLGSTFPTIISFHLKQKFGKDPYEVLLENPKVFYHGLKEILGVGAEATISLVGAYLAVTYDVDCTPEEFVYLFTKDGEVSRKKISAILESVITQEESKLETK